MKHKIIFVLAFTFTSLIFGQSKEDWPNLKRFQKQNDSVKKLDATNRVVFMGNSITEGWSNARPEFFRDKPYINRGIGGQTTPQMLLRFRQDVIDLNPKAVVILAGINDIAGNTGPSTISMIADNILSMIQLAKSNNIEVVLCSVLPAKDFPWRPGMEPGPKVVELNTVLKSYAEKLDLQYVNFYDAMADSEMDLPKELAEDGVHPTVAGYKIMEPLLETAITQVLNK